MTTDRQLIKEYKSIGKEELNLDGAQLTEFIERSVREFRQRQADERAREAEEREKERAREAEEREKERAREAEEREKERAEREKERVREAEKEERDRAEREKEKEREHQLALERLRLEGEQRGDGRGDRPVGVASRPAQITMAMFKENEEAIDSFLAQFEKLALAHQIPQGQWAINLSAFLSGVAKDVYHNLPATDIDNYEELKKALLRHYELTGETFRKWFRGSVKKPTETHPQYHGRLRTLFDKWMRMAEVAQTYEGIREAVLIEQALGTYRRDLVVFLAEREYTTLDEIGQMAERFENAHTRISTWGRDKNNRDGHVEATTETTRDRNDLNGGRPKVGSPSPGQFRGVGKTQGPEKDTRGQKYCTGCNKPGHVLGECRKLRHVNVNVVCTTDRREGVERPELGDGKVNGQDAKVLLDTGSTYPVIVDSKFVKPGDYTREKVVVHLFEGSTHLFKVAYVDLDSPYVKGRVRAACHPGLVYDVVLGDKYVHPRPRFESYGAGVYTTQIAQKSGSMQTEPVTSPITKLQPEQLRRLQEEDASLNRLRKLAEKGSVKQLPDGKVRFTLQRGVLYRCSQNGTGMRKQMVVPVPKREEVLWKAHASHCENHKGVARTRNRVVRDFYWPGVYEDARQFCLSCDRCQKGTQKPWHRREPDKGKPLLENNSVSVGGQHVSGSSLARRSEPSDQQNKLTNDNRKDGIVILPSWLWEVETN